MVNGTTRGSAIRFGSDRGEPRLHVTPHASGETMVAVVDIRGVVVHHHRLSVDQVGKSFEVDLRDLAAGAYMVVVRNAGEVSTEKIVLSR